MVKCDKTNRRKTLDEFALEAEGNEEEASLSLFDLLCIGIGGTVGSGVFVLTGEVYPVAGPSSALCYTGRDAAARDEAGHQSQRLDQDEGRE